ncbi:unnamed protein product [Clonostachys byssicola]|uniref:Methyltransferase domain-containing protein n=1 Tax=Clonostachys byssicola TaxID=160290 RepID=A0A9N9UL04_9HYPO|nr:unnamed protein product [Clonostachys byssicola]
MSEYMYSHAAAAFSPPSSSDSGSPSRPPSRPPSRRKPKQLERRSLDTPTPRFDAALPRESRTASSADRPETAVSASLSRQLSTEAAFDEPDLDARSADTSIASIAGTLNFEPPFASDEPDTPRASLSSATSPRRKRLTASDHFTNFSASTSNFFATTKRSLLKSPVISPGVSPRTTAFSAGEIPKHVAMIPDVESNKSSLSSGSKLVNNSSSFSRTESVSSTSINTALSGRTVTSTDNSASGEAPGNAASNPKPFVQRNGRTYYNDPSLVDPLPIDLTELHRQALRTLLLIQVHGAPVCAPSLSVKPPLKVLELGCGSGFWSMMCHRHFKSRGHTNIQFTGLDIAPLAPGSVNIPYDSIKPDRDMNWTFVQHDIRQPWPFPDNEFDLVFYKDMTLSITMGDHAPLIDEMIRVLTPGGTLEIWESDHIIRMLRPHVPNPTASGTQAEQQEIASSLGAYMINLNTPLSAPLNPFLTEYNNWINKAAGERSLLVTPCTVVNHYLVQETEALKEINSHRVAIPLSEVRWEREGVGGVVTRDGKSYVEMKGDRGPHQKVEKKALTAGQAALRKMALSIVVEEIQSLEPVLREASGKSQDEWDVWMGKMMNDLMSEGGTSWGECLEVGAWWATKR